MSYLAIHVIFSLKDSSYNNMFSVCSTDFKVTLHWAKQKSLFSAAQKWKLELHVTLWLTGIISGGFLCLQTLVSILSSVQMHASPVDLKSKGKSWVLEKLCIWQSLVYVHNLTWNQLIFYVEELIWTFICAGEIKLLLGGTHRKKIDFQYFSGFRF